MKKILIISFSPIARDPRVIRQIQLLENFYQVSVAGFGELDNRNIEYIQLNPVRVRSLLGKVFSAGKLLLGMFEQHYKNLSQVVDAKVKLQNKNYDLILVNDVLALPLALSVGKNPKILLDAHEYSPKEFEDRFLWRLFFSKYYHYLCKEYLPKVNGMVTVCKGIADEYHSQYKIDVDVVHNAPLMQNLLPVTMSSDRVKLIHHGIATPSRNLELMIEMLSLLDNRFTLDLMLVETDPAYMKKLEAMVESNPKVRLVPPVAMQDICSVINQYDVGVFLLPPVNFNYAHALPNKFFEFIQARLAIAIGPSPEMAHLVVKHACGVVANDFSKEALAASLNALTQQQIWQFKLASHQAANELHYGAGADVMLNKIKILL